MVSVPVKVILEFMLASSGPSLVIRNVGGMVSIVLVASFGVGVAGSSVWTLVKLEPETSPWLDTMLTPGIWGNRIVTRKLILSEAPAAIAPILTWTSVSPGALPFIMVPAVVVTLSVSQRLLSVILSL